MATNDTPVVTISNMDIVGLYNRLQTFMAELDKSSSSNVTQYSDADKARLSSYLDSLDTYLKWVNNQPLLDLPKTGPRAYILDPLYAPADPTNDEIADLLRMLTVSRDELISSASSRQPSGMETYDAVRFTTYVAKMRAFLTEYINKATPIDTPETSGKPLTQVPTGPGVQVGR